MSNLFHSLSRHLSIKGSSLSSSSTSLPHFPSNNLIEKVTWPEKLSPKHNIFEEELYVPDDNKRKSDYIIKTAENNIPLGADSSEEFHFLTKQSVRENARHYKYLHIGCVQVAVKPLIREGLNASILIFLNRNSRNKSRTRFGLLQLFPKLNGQFVRCQHPCSLFLNIQIHGLNMKEGSIPAVLIYRIQNKFMNTCNFRVLLKSSDRETTLFVIDMTKASVTVPRLIKWDEIDLPQSWSINRATLMQPRQAPLL
ncbi:hypothetical protein HN51_012620 [Arachis hypogaea]